MSTEPSCILIIEDQPLMRNALRVTLQAAGFGVVESCWDDQILETTCHLTPDLILFSVGTPATNNLQAISLLRKKIPNTSIVAFITGEFPGQEQSALDHGAHLVIQKATSRSALVNTIKKLIKKTPPLTTEAMS
jgi:DNA-binding NarL/FixJ family response regulator